MTAPFLFMTFEFRFTNLPDLLLKVFNFSNKFLKGSFCVAKQHA